MRYTKQFILECVQKYKTGEHIDDPGGCKHKTFWTKDRRWVLIYDAFDSYHVNGNIKPMINLFSKYLLERLQKYISILD